MRWIVCVDMPSLTLIFKQAWRDTRAGDLRLLLLAVIVAVGALTSVGFLADRVSRALERDAAQMLGADVVVEADEPISEELLLQARQRGLTTALTWQFPSMVGTDSWVRPVCNLVNV